MLEVRNQTPLSLRRMLSICVDSISYRLMRSGVTVLIIAVAIAFLADMLIEVDLKRFAHAAVGEHMQSITAYSRFLQAVGRTPTDEQLVRLAATSGGTDEAKANLAQWAALGPDETEEFVEASAAALRYLRFFNRIPVGRRVLLVKQHTRLAIFDWLAAPPNRAQFVKALEPMRSLKVPGTYDAFNAFLDAWASYRVRLGIVKGNYRRMVEANRAAFAPDGLANTLAAAARRDDVATVLDTIAARGYRVTPRMREQIAAGVKRQEDQDWARTLINQPAVRRGWHGAFGETFGPGSALVACSRDGSRIQWIADTLQHKNAATLFDAERFERAANDMAHADRILQASRELPDDESSAGARKTQTYWLIFVSFIVCIVGIANAMLMTVLERFKEIATMKCLGAANNVIAFLFVIEAMFLGVVGGVSGVLIGTFIAFARQMPVYGHLLFEHFQAGRIGLNMAICLGCSVVLTATASVYPARVAARMPPMEAMRID